MNKNDKAKIVDINELLIKFLGQGFTLESLSLVTGLSVETFKRMIDDPTFIPEDHRGLKYLYIFMNLLYDALPPDPPYFSSILESLTNYFGIPNQAIANYLNIRTEDLNSFIKEPNNVQITNNLDIKIMHLFMTFVRDKNFSFERL